MVAVATRSAAAACLLLATVIVPLGPEVVPAGAVAVAVVVFVVVFVVSFVY